MNDKQMAEKIAQAALEKCAWPNCRKGQMMTVSLPVMRVLEGGQVQIDKKIAIPVPACERHMAYFLSGLFAVTMSPDMKQYTVQGPFDIVQIVEAVLNAKEMEKIAVKQREKLAKEIKDSEEGVKAGESGGAQ